MTAHQPSARGASSFRGGSDTARGENQAGNPLPGYCRRCAGGVAIWEQWQQAGAGALTMRSFSASSRRVWIQPLSRRIERKLRMCRSCANHVLCQQLPVCVARTASRACAARIAVVRDSAAGGWLAPEYSTAGWDGPPIQGAASLRRDVTPQTGGAMGLAPCRRPCRGRRRRSPGTQCAAATCTRSSSRARSW